MIRRKIVTKCGFRRVSRLSDATFGGDDDLFAHFRGFLERLAENCLSDSVAINVSVVEERVTRVVSREHGLAALLHRIGRHRLCIPGAGNSPAAERETAGNKGRFAYYDSFHPLRE